MRLTKNFLLIGNPHQPWRKTLQAAVKPLGELDVFDETKSHVQGYEKRYDVVLIDATEVEPSTEEWVARLRTQLPSARIVVVAAAPSWQRAREAFLAGAMDYVNKSVEKDKLSKFLSALLDKPVA